MTEGAGPGITGIHHVSATVTDVEASVAYSTVVFRDPDNIQLEFIALG